MFRFPYREKVAAHMLFAVCVGFFWSVSVAWAQAPRNGTGTTDLSGAATEDSSGGSSHYAVNSPPHINRFWVKGAAITEDRRYGTCQNRRRLLLDLDVQASPHSNLVSAELQYLRRGRRLASGDYEYTQIYSDTLDATATFASELRTRRIEGDWTLRLVVRGRDNEESQVIHLFFDVTGRCSDGIDYNGIPWATTVAESKERLDERRRAVMEYWAGKPLRLDNWNGESGNRETSAQILFAKLWRAYFDPDFSGDRAAVVTDVNDYLTNSAVHSWNIGTLEDFTKFFGYSGEDYDFVLRVLTKLMYTFKDVSGTSPGVVERARSLGPALRAETKTKLLNSLLTQSGTDHHTLIFSRDDMKYRVFGILMAAIASGAASPFTDLVGLNIGSPITVLACTIFAEKFVKGDMSETENHILMSETSRYLKNQLLLDDTGDVRYNNGRNGFDDWMKRHLQQFLVSGFNEYNSPTYQGYSIAALANLVEYARSSEVRTVARMALELISASYAVQSYDLKRVVGFHRRPDNAKDRELWQDAATGFFSVQFGNYAGLMDNSYSGVWPWGLNHAFSSAAAQDYTVLDLIADIGIEKGHNPYEVRVNHTSGGDLSGNSPHTQNVEILTGRKEYLLSAGGRTSTPNYWYASLLGLFSDDHNGWSRPTTLITRGYQRLTAQATGADTPDAEGLTDFLIATTRSENATGVYRNMAFGSFTVPAALEGHVTSGRHNWKIVSLPDAGVLVAVHETGGVLEVVPDADHGGFTLDSFRRAVESQNPTRRYASALDPTLAVVYYTDAAAGTWVVDPEGTHPSRSYHTWPFIESESRAGLSRVIWADGLGKVVVNNPTLGQSLIMSMVDWRRPIRIHQGCVAEDLTSGAGVSVSASSHTPSRAVDSSLDTAWNPTDRGNKWLKVDFGRQESFRFVSIRHDRSLSAYAELQVEISDNNRDWTSASRLAFPANPGAGLDLDLGARRARYVRFTFTPVVSGGSERDFAIRDIEIYRYGELLDPDEYEPNDDAAHATPIEAGSHQASLHVGTDIDYYAVDLLANNALRAEVEGTFTSSPNVEILARSGSSTSSITSGSGIATAYDEAGAHHGRNKHFIRVSHPRGETGTYRLYVQTQGPNVAAETPEPAGRQRITPVAPTSDNSATTIATRQDKTATVRGAIETAGRWQRFCLGECDRDIDHYVVTVPSGYSLEVTVEPDRPSYGQPYGKLISCGTGSGRSLCDVYSEEQTEAKHVMRIGRTSPCLGQYDVQFNVTGLYNNDYRRDTGLYTLTFTLKSQGDFARAASDVCRAAIEAMDTHGYTHDPSDLAMMQQPPVIVEFDRLRHDGDPVVLVVKNRKDGKVISSYKTKVVLSTSNKEIGMKEIGMYGSFLQFFNAPLAQRQAFSSKTGWIP